MNSNCVFCKIVQGDLPALKVHEDENSLAFLDIGPLAEAHLLLIPKAHYARLDDMSADLIAAVCTTLPRLARAVTAVAGVSDYNILQNNGSSAGQVVEHVHFHIIPRRDGDGLGYRWPAGTYETGRAEALQAQLLEKLSQTP